MVVWTKVDSGGRIVIPASMRKAMKLEPGDNVQISLVENELRIVGRDAAIARAQALVRKYVPGNVSLSDQLIAERGSYDTLTAELDGHDTRVYESFHGLDDAVAAATGLSLGASFHFVLNNVIVKDNRIPPRGFTNAGFASVQAAPVAANYADGQYWDDARYHTPAGTAKAVVILYYQSTSKEYIDFLRDENATNTNGQLAHDQWTLYGKSAPIIMATQILILTPHPSGDYNASGTVDLDDHAYLPNCLQGPDVPAAPACQPFDCDNDGDVDAYDVAAFNLAYSNDL